MTAWQKLIAGSALSSGTAWQHLNAQVGGGGGMYIYDSLSVELIDEDYCVDLDRDHDVVVDNEFFVELEDEAS